MRSLMRPFAIALLAMASLAGLPIFSAAFAEEPQVVDGIAAIVNGEVITYSQVRSLSAPREKLLRSQLTGKDLESKLLELRQLALRDLVDRRLVIQAFKKESYQIPDHFVDQRMHEIMRESFGGDRNTFISPTKIEDYYRKHHEEFTTKEEIKLRMIMISGQKDTASATAQKALAEEVLGRLASGAEFDRTAQVYSEDSTRDNGGDWGWIERKTLAEPLEKFAFNMPVGRVSNIIDYAGNYYILKVEDKHGGTTKSLAEARDDIEKRLIQEEAQGIQERWIAGLRAKAYIKTF